MNAALLAAIAAGDAVALRAALAQGASPAGSDPQGVPVLVLACRLGRLDLVEPLLEAGASWDARYGDGADTPAEGLPAPEPDGRALVDGLQQIVGALESFGGITRSGHVEDDFSSGTRERLDHDGENAFEAAIRRGHAEVVARLLRAGAQVEPRTWEATPPLVLAARAGYPAVVRVLLGAGARPDQGFDETALQAAAAAGQLGAVEALLEAGADPDLADDDGFTPLMIAAGEGHLPVVQRLVAAGADVEHQAEGDCALACAVHGGHRPVRDFLSPLVSRELRDGVAEALHEPLERQRERGSSMEAEDLIEAALAGELERVEAGLASGLDPNAIGSDGQTALHYAAFWGQLPVVERLLAAGARVDVRSEDDGPANAPGTTALTLAAGSVFAPNRHRIVRRLIAAGADVDAQNDAGQTPLMNAIAEGRGFPKSVEALLEAGADPDLRDQQGRSALLVALAQGNEAIVGMLRAAGASEQGVLGHDLIQAAEAGDLPAVEMLLAEDAPNGSLSARSAALHAACGQGHVEIAAALSAAGADLNWREGHDDFNPLLSAAYGGQLEAVRWLIAAGADLTVAIPGMGTALDYARLGKLERNHPDQPWEEVIALLEQAGTPSRLGPLE